MSAAETSPPTAPIRPPTNEGVVTPIDNDAQDIEAGTDLQYEPLKPTISLSLIRSLQKETEEQVRKQHGNPHSILVQNERFYISNILGYIDKERAKQNRLARIQSFGGIFNAIYAKYEALSEEDLKALDTDQRAILNFSLNAAEKALRRISESDEWKQAVGPEGADKAHDVLVKKTKQHALEIGGLALSLTILAEGMPKMKDERSGRYVAGRVKLPRGKNSTIAVNLGEPDTSLLLATNEALHRRKFPSRHPQA